MEVTPVSIKKLKKKLLNLTNLKNMKKQLTLSLFLALFLLAPVSSLFAQKTAPPAEAQTTGTWDALGTVVAARMGGDHDAIEITETDVVYKKLKLKVTDAPLNIKKMVITFANGKTQTVNTKYQIKNGGESNITDLKEPGQPLKTVELWYDTKGLLKGKANVTVMGMK